MRESVALRGRARLAALLNRLDRAILQGLQRSLLPGGSPGGLPHRLSRLLVALTIALTWLTLAALPEIGAPPRGWHNEVARWGRVRVISLALELLDVSGNIPLACLLSTFFRGGYA